jgi:hypothetical protein
MHIYPYAAGTEKGGSSRETLPLAMQEAFNSGHWLPALHELGLATDGAPPCTVSPSKLVRVVLSALTQHRVLGGALRSRVGGCDSSRASRCHQSARRTIIYHLYLVSRHR